MLFDSSRPPGLTLADQIQALSGAGVGTSGNMARELLMAMSRDVTIPPAWRLKAASEGRMTPRKNSSTIDVILDEGISTRARLAALKELKRSDDAEAALLVRIADTARVDSWDRLSIAEAALEVKDSDLVQRLLQDVLADTPHSIAELAKAAELFHAIDEDRRASVLLKRIL